MIIEYNNNDKEGERTYKITLGDTFMHNHDIIFDKDNQRIGFAAADCNRRKLKRNNNLNSNSKNDNKNNNNNDVILKEKDKNWKNFNFNNLVFDIILLFLSFYDIDFKSLKIKLCYMEKYGNILGL